MKFVLSNMHSQLSNSFWWQWVWMNWSLVQLGSQQMTRELDMLDCWSRLIDILMVDSAVNQDLVNINFEWVIISPRGVISSWTEVVRPATQRLGHMARVAMHCCSASEVNRSLCSVVCSLTNLLLWLFTVSAWLLIWPSLWCWSGCSLLTWKSSIGEIRLVSLKKRLVSLEGQLERKGWTAVFTAYGWQKEEWHLIIWDCWKEAGIAGRATLRILFAHGQAG